MCSHCQEGVRAWPGDYASRRAGVTVLLVPSQLPFPSRRRAACGFVIQGRVLVPVRGWGSGLASTHSVPHQRAGGRHDRVPGDRAAQSCDRAGPWRPAHGARSERARGLGGALLPSRLLRRCAGFGLDSGQQVSGAGQQLAGDRNGGDLSSRGSWRGPSRWRRTPVSAIF
jgi:hypothetical protein